jgi:hypothetical protein
MQALATAVETAAIPVAKPANARKPRQGFVPIPQCHESENPIPTGRFWSHRYRVWCIRDCGTHAWAVYSCIASHADWGGKAWPGTDRIMQMTGFARSTVFDALKWLAAHRWVKIGKRRGAKGNYNVYQVVEPYLPPQR